MLFIKPSCIDKKSVLLALESKPSNMETTYLSIFVVPGIPRSSGRHKLRLGNLKNTEMPIHDIKSSGSKVTWLEWIGNQVTQ
jgi:hypothetical protein